MMMTCRLLCALLILALCCCPSVCVKTAVLEGGKRSKDSDAPENISGENGRQNGKDGSPELKSKESEDESASGTQLKEARSTDGTSKSDRASDEPGKTSTVDQSAKKPKLEDPVEKTTTTTTNTTTTMAPTTTTTTTKVPITSTTVPEAPNTTNTEAPTTTTTTRAPSRLREIDGSLSSSAWVCAPLLLAASALAYTALG
ncbi:putative mucin TcMUCII [Trypanosoma cruzi]|uniref:Mucin TcMUCII, putative n=2 Tax=Trypanosoma cruzi TaxID=5693 RepID=Q4E3D5_TRYCC|nr:mucin TcMUCII, putative [Trypanosoma cruzi]EAN99299.1 mucin TcMUCII, putative [Trypanosoma cruzi]PWV20767.1 putative mucin TcMUCII [Trypanosoma cruzi]|eukprot:XP_821150.1 mucin TcMUCII [Trypanosoma cruzi strain CL Brener]